MNNVYIHPLMKAEQTSRSVAEKICIGVFGGGPVSWLELCRIKREKNREEISTRDGNRVDR